MNLYATGQLGVVCRHFGRDPAVQESTKLAAACSIAVTGTMAITTLLACYVAIYNWHWPKQLVKVGCLLLTI